MARNAAGEAAVINLSSLNIPEEKQRKKTALLKKDVFQPTKKGVNPVLVLPLYPLARFPERGRGGHRKSGLFFCCPLGKYLFTFNSRINYFLSCPSYQVQASPRYNQPLHLQSSEVTTTAENAMVALDSSNICLLQASWKHYWRSQWDGTVNF